MLSTFQKAVLATVAGSAILIALVLAAMRPAGAGPITTLGAPTTFAVAAGNGGIAPGVVTLGDATVKVRPDIAILSAGATAQAATAAEAQTAIAGRIERILAAAKALGIADKDVQTSSYQIQPLYAQDTAPCCGAPRITGYQATQMLALTLRRIEDAGKALDALVRNDGATNASVAFTLEDPKAAQAEARKLAVEDAHSKADAMARTAGASLGKVLSISDQSSSVPYEYKRLDAVGAAPAPATQVPVGDLEIVVRVQVQFAID